ncbi:phospholipase D family protein [Marinobacter sp. 1_MG-2023]|uniref:phospholipase D family protein n=1 Tax=Marinobacter sp. 1_MG-2023 TaxID=3062627 RepID=UPI0026E15A8A|nr:phospholipase D family protein [Marinobacter sp. 1_MG-2023]MDO6823855.1 phospholipase D family protein [Marinobacter sp. 1_MG-2023]
MSLKVLLALVVLTLIGIGFYHSYKPIPQGISYNGDDHPLHDAVLLTDTTYHHSDGSETRDHEIFNEILRLVSQARSFVLVDMFLYNSSSPEDVEHRQLSEQLTEALIQRKTEQPELEIIVISDPLNTLYGGSVSPWFQALREAGIEVTVTNLRPLRDSNPAWSAIWRLCCQWFGNNSEGGWLPNALGTEPVTIRSYLALPNFKANHRKVLVTDEGNRLRALVTSANPHDGSSRHSNTAISFTGPAVTDILKTEQAVLALSDQANPSLDTLINAPNTGQPANQSDAGRIAVKTESAILDSALQMISEAQSGSQLDLAFFYLSHREIVGALLDAHHRDVHVRVLLDANNEAFGHQKSGIPNRQVALELHRAGIPVRWCNTFGEQCHSKLLILRPLTGHTELLLGSANFTRRNLDDLNLETDVWVSVPADSEVAMKAVDFFERQWQSGPGSDPVMSLPYERWADDSTLRYWRYRLMEATGLSTF